MQITPVRVSGLENNRTSPPAVRQPQAQPSGDEVTLRFGHQPVKFPEYAPPPFNADFHKERRDVLLKQLPPDTTVIIPGADLVRRNGDVDHNFRQESNFYYLTGFEEPGSFAMLSNVKGLPEFTLIVPPRDKARETWDGKRAGAEDAERKYGADKAYTTTIKQPKLLEYMEKSPDVAIVPAVANEKANDFIQSVFAQAEGKTGQQTKNVSWMLDEMRLIKTPYEQDLLRRACEVSAKGHLEAMKNLRLTPEQMIGDRAEGRNEGEIQAEFEYNTRKHGAVRLGYQSIAGAGSNGCILHYIENKEYAKPGDLALVDMGGEYGYYTADITRTWPISGKFTPEQKAVYDIVLKAQESGIQMTRPGATMREIHLNSIRVITEGLLELGILKGDSEKSKAENINALIRERAFGKYFMHGTSHMLGMDVHDVPAGPPSPDNPQRNQGIAERPLEPGMFLTVEPGIYIDPDVAKAEGVDPKWWGIGVRIEDDILVTKDGFENFSAMIPRATEDIEALMNPERREPKPSQQPGGLRGLLSKLSPRKWPRRSPH